MGSDHSDTSQARTDVTEFADFDVELPVEFGEAVLDPLEKPGHPEATQLWMAYVPKGVGPTDDGTVNIICAMRNVRETDEDEYIARSVYWMELPLAEFTELVETTETEVINADQISLHE